MASFPVGHSSAGSLHKKRYFFAFLRRAIACEPQTYFRSSLLFLRKIRLGRGRDNKPKLILRKLFVGVLRSQVLKWVWILETRSENGFGKWHFLVWRRVRIWRTGRRSPLRISRRTPRGDSESRAGKRSEKWVKVLRCLKFPSGRTSRGDHACHFLVTAVITINFTIKIL